MSVRENCCFFDPQLVRHFKNEYMFIPESELILNPDNSIYHLKLKPGEIAKDIITVGDPDRVDMVAKYLDKREIERSCREFKTITGSIGDRRLTIISTGIGTDNIDIVFNELDALVNVDFDTRKVKEDHTALNFYRIGTSGAIREDVPLDSIVVSRYALGFDGLLHFYESDGVREHGLERCIDSEQSRYGVSSSVKLFEAFKRLGKAGVTVTADGFYGPQSRAIRVKPSFDVPTLFGHKSYKDVPFTNLEMETAGIYGLAALLGHEAISLNAILANRITRSFSSQPVKTVDRLIEDSLRLIVKGI